MVQFITDRSYGIRPKCQMAGVNLDNAGKATSHIKTMTRERENSEELTSVNCRGQTPTFSPSLASIQCSSTRLMTVRMSPCKPELSNRDTESVRKDEKQINRWNKKKKNQDARCLSVFTLETEHSALKLSEPWVYPAACDINSLYVCRPSAFCSQLLLWKPFDHLH